MEISFPRLLDTCEILFIKSCLRVPELCVDLRGCKSDETGSVVLSLNMAKYGPTFFLASAALAYRSVASERHANIYAHATYMQEAAVTGRSDPVVLGKTSY